MANTITMVNNYITDEKLIELGVSNDTPEIKAVIIKELIEQHYTFDMANGDNYYNNQNDIKERVLTYWEDGSEVEDDGNKTNSKLSHNWHKILVDQKTAYLVGKPITFYTEEEKLGLELEQILDEDFDDEANELVKEASNKGVAYLQVYIDEVDGEGKGKFRFIRIPAEEIIPIFDTDRQRDLVELIRYYSIDENGTSLLKAEWWTDSNVTYFVQTVNGDFVLDPDRNPNPSPHFMKNKVGMGWGKVPFILFKNNEEMNNDLTFYQELVDVYDLINSDMANDVIDFQKALMVIKGYEGNDSQELIDNLKYHKIINVGEGGDVDKLELNIPTDAFEKFVNRLEENIFVFGQGVNVKTDRFGNSPTGVALLFIYTLLDLKSGILERKFRRGLRHLLWFITQYLKFRDGKEYDYKSIQVTFNKTTITNQSEMVRMALESKGIVSDETILSNHPFVDDVAEEKERIKEELAGSISLEDDVSANDESGNISETQPEE